MIMTTGRSLQRSDRTDDVRQHVAAKLRAKPFTRCRQQGPRHQGDPGMARPSVDHEHRGLYGHGSDPRGDNSDHHRLPSYQRVAPSPGTEKGPQKEG
jgi:hypothetical protein